MHHSFCYRYQNLAQIYLVGFYEQREFALYVSSISNELKIPVKYLKEDKPHGSAGGLYNFRDLIMEDNPSHIFLLNCDVCCIPLPEMLEAHKRYGGMGTILVIKVSPESADQFGELVADADTNELLHYTEKPETFVSDRINCGVYVFTPEIFTAIQSVSAQRKDRANLRRLSSFEAQRSESATRSLPADFVRLALPFTGSYKLLFKYVKSSKFAQIGPNVSISANARIAAGARLINCIVLDDVEIKENAVVILSIVGWKCSIGRWSRVQAEGDHKAKLGVTILGEAVNVEDEVVVINCIVLPNKTLNVSV
ncbi:uncharacterized protein LOC143570505 [Bidens hawaiensis]|uniref:uncharacterized protein LOC143570505 n=1 Tax=Bidens hawaiensis TaxID=980011 RepID=UPI00404A5544